MQRVIVNMKSYVMSDAIKLILKDKGDFKVLIVDDVCDVVNKCYSYAANTVIMEVTDYEPWNLEQRLKIREDIKKRCPNSKIAILVDENENKEIAEKVKQAKLDGLVDQFIYGSISASYLVALLETI